ncbi:MAG: spore coat protein U domain-containing protein [Spirochaetales bacterium]|uniref:Spore coat protein U domain-containing protein n=1 Tax=Candidatus Thalassospirochaeta sargassi TaxID=3119039 RepID=A0AAJ1MJN0_9SPIO|nr:spore coat protein U domain-containing protein [Spirochaetales bacterium]
MNRKVLKTVSLTLTSMLCLLSSLTADDIFQFNAPPGGVYLNSSFEQTSTEIVTITVEHEGVAIPDWYIAADEGTSGSYEPRELFFSSNTMDYQLYTSAPPSSDIMKAPPESLAAANVISTTDFDSDPGAMEQKTYSIYFHIASGQFIPAGTYSDTITLYLYIGDYSDAIADTLADSVNITVYGRMASLLDIYSVNEPGIRYMDLTITEVDKLIATVNERSNSSTGYTVSITSYNLANDISGATVPFFLHSYSDASLDYSLTYDEAAVGPWSSGTAQLTDSMATTLPEWLSKELDISYNGSTDLAAGDYEDILTLTISAK